MRLILPVACIAATLLKLIIEMSEVNSINLKKGTEYSGTWPNHSWSIRGVSILMGIANMHKKEK